MIPRAKPSFITFRGWLVIFGAALFIAGMAFVVGRA